MGGNRDSWASDPGFDSPDEAPPSYGPGGSESQGYTTPNEAPPPGDEDVGQILRDRGWDEGAINDLVVPQAAPPDLARMDDGSIMVYGKSYGGGAPPESFPGYSPAFADANGQDYGSRWPQPPPPVYGGKSQPSIDQIQAENDTLNGNAPPPYSPAFGSYSISEVRDALLGYGWKPDVADQVANKIHTDVESGIPAGGYYHPGNPGRVTVNPDNRGTPEEYGDLLNKNGVPFTLEHEMHHSVDYDKILNNPAPSAPPGSFRSGPNGRLDTGALADLNRLANDQEYPTAAGVARNLIDDPKGPVAGGDYDHLNHYLIDRLNFDHTLLPPDIQQRQFPYANDAQSFVSLQRALMGDQSQRDQAQTGRVAPGEQPAGEVPQEVKDRYAASLRAADFQSADEEQRRFAMEHPEYTPEIITARQAHWDQYPWWLNVDEPLPGGPPPVIGPYDHDAGDMGGYVDRETGQYIPYPRER